MSSPGEEKKEEAVGLKEGQPGIDAPLSEEEIGSGGEAVEGVGFDGVAAEGVGFDGDAVDGVGFDGEAVEGVGIAGEAAEEVGLAGGEVEEVGFDGVAVEEAGRDGVTGEEVGVEGVASEEIGFDGVAAHVSTSYDPSQVSPRGSQPDDPTQLILSFSEEAGFAGVSDRGPEANPEEVLAHEGVAGDEQNHAQPSNSIPQQSGKASLLPPKARARRTSIASTRSKDSKQSGLSQAAFSSAASTDGNDFEVDALSPLTACSTEEGTVATSPMTCESGGYPSPKALDVHRAMPGQAISPRCSSDSGQLFHNRIDELHRMHAYKLTKREKETKQQEKKEQDARDKARQEELKFARQNQGRVADAVNRLFREDIAQRRDNADRAQQEAGRDMPSFTPRIITTYKRQQASEEREEAVGQERFILLHEDHQRKMQGRREEADHARAAEEVYMQDHSVHKGLELRNPQEMYDRTVRWKSKRLRIAQRKREAMHEEILQGPSAIHKPSGNGDQGGDVASQCVDRMWEAHLEREERRREASDARAKEIDERPLNWGTPWPSRKQLEMQSRIAERRSEHHLFEDACGRLQKSKKANEQWQRQQMMERRLHSVHAVAQHRCMWGEAELREVTERIAKRREARRRHGLGELWGSNCHSLAQGRQVTKLRGRRDAVVTLIPDHEFDRSPTPSQSESDSEQDCLPPALEQSRRAWRLRAGQAPTAAQGILRKSVNTCSGPTVGSIRSAGSKIGVVDTPTLRPKGKAAVCASTASSASGHDVTISRAHGQPTKASRPLLRKGPQSSHSTLVAPSPLTPNCGVDPPKPGSHKTKGHIVRPQAKKLASTVSSGGDPQSPLRKQPTLQEHNPSGACPATQPATTLRASKSKQSPRLSDVFGTQEPSHAHTELPASARERRASICGIDLLPSCGRFRQPRESTGHTVASTETPSPTRIVESAGACDSFDATDLASTAASSFRTSMSTSASRLAVPAATKAGKPRHVRKDCGAVGPHEPMSKANAKEVRRLIYARTVRATSIAAETSEASRSH
mmetsp:Transcript_11799/g.32033  ORF Transcript_11799/g.32033 Transcript_11799/m.32033 type:complete len:1033 (-) Transcript_11799:241-3339(-)